MSSLTVTVPQRAAPMAVPSRALRPPCTALGLTVDTALAGPGAVAHGITRDPPASSATLGINACAGFAVAAKAAGVELPRK
ncbi:hypothetical protein [Streptomyces phaeochromogenes]|uniref:hypothetical protein n=1 Tax=Streptomyces phaeochromogenes TaxID=1923 RepID=UPI0036C7D540